jgi:hypothetical protein
MVAIEIEILSVGKISGTWRARRSGTARCSGLAQKSSICVRRRMNVPGGKRKPPEPKRPPIGCHPLSIAVPIVGVTEGEVLHWRTGNGRLVAAPKITA